MSQKKFTYVVDIKGEIEDIKQKLGIIKNEFQTFSADGKIPELDKVLKKLGKNLDGLREKTINPITSLVDYSKIKRETDSIVAQMSLLEETIGTIRGLTDDQKMELFPSDLVKKIKDAAAAEKKFEKQIKQSKEETKELKEAREDLARAESEQAKANLAVKEAETSEKLKRERLDNYKESEKIIKKQISTVERLRDVEEQYAKSGLKRTQNLPDGTNYQQVKKEAVAVATSLGLELDPKSADSYDAVLQSLNGNLKETQKQITATNNAVLTAGRQVDAAKDKVTAVDGTVTSLRKTLNNIETTFESDKIENQQAAYDEMRASAGRLGVSLRDIPLQYTEENAEKVKVAMAQLKQQGLDAVNHSADAAEGQLEQLKTVLSSLVTEIDRTGIETKQMDEQLQNAQAFAARLKQFVGLEGAIYAFRRAITAAIQDIKELDATMTEMAVVTDLEIGDYWEQLPEHTDRASELGLAINDVYKAETLYYQQGLKTNEVVAMSTETLKMARIAGLEAEDATNKMTAALRGFRMELDEVSTRRVSDVYSELAAITASDVDEISSAMTKTASIAASANMEFETTAAFLTQIIETTRESAETAGTALKTVIARFQELKKNPAEIGEVDGEAVDANKIETALRSVGVKLRDTSGQFRDLDKVFLELSSKWDTLDTNTQRYIATIAAGSR